MRILLSIHHRLDRNSGAAGVVMRLSEEFAALGHEVRVASFDDMPGNLPQIARRILYPFVLGRIARRWQPDVIDASSGDAWWYYAGCRSGRLMLRITHSHGLEHLSSAVEIEEGARAGRRPGSIKRLFRHGLRLRLVARSFRKADLCFVLNDSEAAFLRDGFGIEASRICCIRLGSDHAGRKGSSKFIGEARRIVQIGAFTIRKGIEHTVPAMSEVLRRRPDASMLFVGTGTGRAQVVNRFPVDVRHRIRVIPSYDNSRLPQLIDGAAICLMPSLFEGYGIAKIEAMACGVVPITSDDPGSATDIADGVDGLVIPRGRTEPLRDAVLDLLDDHERRRAMAVRARAKAAEFSWSKAARHRAGLYETALAELRGGVIPVA